MGTGNNGNTTALERLKARTANGKMALVVKSPPPVEITQPTDNSPLAGKQCDSCSDTHWWTPRGRNAIRCGNCDSPPKSRALIGEEYFFDDNGVRWNISLEKYFERWTKVISI